MVPSLCQGVLVWVATLPPHFKRSKYDMLSKLLQYLIGATIPFSFLSSISGVVLLLCSVFFLKYSTDRTGHSSDMVPTSAFKSSSLAAFSVLGFIACVGIIPDLFIIRHDGLKEWVKAYIPRTKIRSSQYRFRIQGRNRKNEKAWSQCDVTSAPRIASNTAPAQRS